MQLIASQIEYMEIGALMQFLKEPVINFGTIDVILSALERV